MKTGLHNTSEIGRLRKVMLHYPGRELENLMPEYLERLLFDDIPYLKVAQAEHDAFANCLRDNGADVVYLKDLVTETIQEPEIRKELVDQFLDEAGIDKHRIREILCDYFSGMADSELVDTLMAGVRKSDVRGFETGKLSDYLSFRSDDYPFLIDPMPNLYFTRDPFATIGTGVSLHRMHTVTRNRETLFGKFIFKYHPLYKDAPKWYDRGESSSLEGGDILILSPRVIAVGISQRTEEDSIDKFAHTVLSISETFKKILAFDIPKTRSFMHLDTVF
ncbi:MAG: arginine deiminase, partial [Oscillospiraceae bacterium]|nr:arginine deiminase [Oscillospiraceae bacterium]